MEMSRPLKISPTLGKLEQAKAYLQKVLPNYTWESYNPHHEAPALGKASRTRALSFHKVSLHTAQIVVVMETEACPMRPSITVSVSAMIACLTMRSGPRIDALIKGWATR
ncbi:hypothetical protein ILYODFUR_032384 [Ilyodon furcidens]|uniref:Uncharacterized protein n=1 Tax=Ilyodon furcidens TaxID=33524 RepID=A0ABV0TEB6_9TELE